MKQLHRNQTLNATILEEEPYVMFGIERKKPSLLQSAMILMVHGFVSHTEILLGMFLLFSELWGGKLFFCAVWGSAPSSKFKPGHSHVKRQELFSDQRGRNLKKLALLLIYKKHSGML